MVNLRSLLRVAIPVAMAATALTPAIARGTTNAPAQVIEVHAKKFGYQPAEITLHKGQTYKLHLTSDDVPHSLRIKPLDVNVVIKPGAFHDVLVTPEQVAEYTGDCGVFCGPGHRKMSMAVHVVE